MHPEFKLSVEGKMRLLEDLDWENKNLKAENKKLQQQKDSIEEKMMQLELHLADTIATHKTKADAARDRLKIAKKYAFEKETGLNQALGCIVILIAIIIANLGSCRCN